MKTDASDFAISAVLTQQDAPVAYFSAKLSSGERLLSVDEKETLAVVRALTHWRHYLYQHFTLFTDNPVVSHLMTKSNLTRRQAQWIEVLADFNFTTVPISGPGKTNVADPISLAPTSKQTTLLSSPPPGLCLSTWRPTFVASTRTTSTHHTTFLWPEAAPSPTFSWRVASSIYCLRLQVNSAASMFRRHPVAQSFNPSTLLHCPVTQGATACSHWPALLSSGLAARREGTLQDLRHPPAQQAKHPQPSGTASTSSH